MPWKVAFVLQVVIMDEGAGAHEPHAAPVQTET